VKSTAKRTKQFVLHLPLNTLYNKMSLKIYADRQSPVKIVFIDTIIEFKFITSITVTYSMTRYTQQLLLSRRLHTRMCFFSVLPMCNTVPTFVFFRSSFTMWALILKWIDLLSNIKVIILSVFSRWIFTIF